MDRARVFAVVSIASRHWRQTQTQAGRSHCVVIDYYSHLGFRPGFTWNGGRRVGLRLAVDCDHPALAQSFRVSGLEEAPKSARGTEKLIPLSALVPFMVPSSL